MNESALVKWNHAVASEAFTLFQEHVCTLLYRHGGYLVRVTLSCLLESWHGSLHTAADESEKKAGMGLLQRQQTKVGTL